MTKKPKGYWHSEEGTKTVELIAQQHPVFEQMLREFIRDNMLLNDTSDVVAHTTAVEMALLKVAAEWALTSCTIVGAKVNSNTFLFTARQMFEAALEEKEKPPGATGGLQSE